MSRPIRNSSPAGAPERRSSKFTYRHISQLASYSTSCPLRVIAHIDLDAFYAQCEMVRLGVPEHQPLAVQQWQGLIAINYPARTFGIGRLVTVTEAKKLCPNLTTQHVATWREGETKWAYRDDAEVSVATDKVSLDPYRIESRKILALIKAHLPANFQKVEKASIDEVFLDLSAQIHLVLLQRFPELAKPAPFDDPTERLPMPPVTVLDWKADALVDQEDQEDQDAAIGDPDWDDVAMLIGSEIVRGVRAAIREKFGYTCSAGVATNKMLSKLGSGYKKPNQQTVIRNRAIPNFLSAFKFTKIRNLGGKLGDQITEDFQTETVKELLTVAVDRLKSKIGEDTGLWLYNTIRGIDLSKVNSRTLIKSMLSAKSFRPSISTVDQATKWLRIFVGDIFARLVEEGVLDNKRRPRIINLHHRLAGQTRSRQSPIPQGKVLDEDTLFELASNLLHQVVLGGKVWPCSNLSLSVGGFEDGVAGNMGIDAFLLKGTAAHALRSSLRDSTTEPSGQLQQRAKRRRRDAPGIERFFFKQQSTGDGELSYDAVMASNTTAQLPNGTSSGPAKQRAIDSDLQHDLGTSILCRRCYAVLEDPAEYQSHQDWHFAKDLQDQECVQPVLVNNRPATALISSSSMSSGKSSKRSAKSKNPEVGQSKLKFS